MKKSNQDSSPTGNNSSSEQRSQSDEHHPSTTEEFKASYDTEGEIAWIDPTFEYYRDEEFREFSPIREDLLELLRFG